MAKHVLVAVFLVLAFVAPPHGAEGASKWLRLRSPHFVLVGDATEADIRAVAERVEAFRQALSQSLPARASLSAVPTVIVVFRSDESFKPYKPLFQGKPAQLAGYFQAGENINYIALNVAGRDAAYSIIFHEFAHELVNNRVLSVPLWLNEGIAELYRTFQDKNGGRTAIIGLAPPEHVYTLRQTPFMPLPDLMGVTHESPVYNEGSRRGLFYAESWALTHYLLLGNDSRRAQLLRYMLDLNEGRTELEALRHAFGVEPQVLENEVREYIRRYLFPATEFTFDRSVRQAVRSAEPITVDEAQAYLADLLSHTGRADEARVIFERILKTSPDNARALAGLGSLDVHEHRMDEGLPLLRRAASLVPDDPWIVASLGDALATRLQNAGSTGEPDAVQEARAVLEKATALAPDDAHLAAARGAVEMVVGERMGEARAFFERAVALAPTREAYSLMLAQAMIGQHDYLGATKTLGFLLAHGSRPEVKDRARLLLTRVAELRMESMQPAQASQRPQGDGAQPVQLPAAAATLSTSSASSGRPPYTPDLRPLGEGELRVLGQFQAVECPRGRIVLVVGIADRVIRLTAARFEDVQFISYREDSPQGVNCGPVAPPSRALATYRSSANAPGDGDGEAVAIELIPDDYTPRSGR